jgi:YHS domain-containing protein
MKSAFLVALSVCILLMMVGCNRDQAENTAAPAPSTGSATPRGETGTAPVSTGAPLGTIEVGDQAVCTICATENESHGVEEVKATLDYEGKTYAFCSEAEKAEFISNPAKYTGNGE